MGAYSPPSYTGTDVANAVKRTFGDEAGVQVTDADILRWINAAQEEIVSVNRILKGVGTTPLVVGTYDYSLSATSMDIKNIQSITVGGRKLKYMSFVDAESYILAEDPDRTATGTPEFWYEWAGVINLYPTPDKVETLTIYYIKNPERITDITATLGVPDNYYNRVIEYVLSQAYELDENLQAHDIKNTQFQSNLVSMADDETQPVNDAYPVITIRPEDR